VVLIHDLFDKKQTNETKNNNYIGGFVLDFGFANWHEVFGKNEE